MNHPDDLLSAYLDGELDLWEEARLRAHLEHCPACRVELADLHRVRGAVRSLPRLDLPSSLALERPGAAATSRRLRWAGALAAAAMVVAIGLAFFASPSAITLDLEAIADRHAARAILDRGPLPVRLAGAVNE